MFKLINNLQETFLCILTQGQGRRENSQGPGQIKILFGGPYDVIIFKQQD